MSKQHGEAQLEAACQNALTLGACSYKSLESILRQGLERLPLAPQNMPLLRDEHVTYAALATTAGLNDLSMASYAKTDLLILDDWGLALCTAAQWRDMLELLDDRYGNRSTLVTSQMPVDRYNALVGDAILDRLVHDACRIELKGESMHRRATKLTAAEASH